MITGATAGIGLETARSLAARGFHVLLHGRTHDNAARAVDEIGVGRLSPLHANLADQAELREMAGRIKQNFPKLDVLINNAGTWNSRREYTREGIEKTFAINHLAPFLLTGLLHDHLQPAARIICVASDSHRQVKGMSFADYGLEHNYHGLRSYAQSKLANLLFCYEYERRKVGKTVICAVQPGLVSTDIGLKGNTWLHALAWRVRRKMRGNKSPLEGAATSIYLATVVPPPPSGLYWDECRPKPSSVASMDEIAGSRLWGDSERLTGINFQP